MILSRLVGDRSKAVQLAPEIEPDEPSLPASGMAPNRPFRIPADALRCLDNVYQLELAPDGIPYRWTGPGCAFAIFLPVDRQHAIRFTLVCRSSASPFNWENVFSEVEGDMHLCCNRSDGDRHYLDGTIPARGGMQGAILRIHLQETRQPLPNRLGHRDPRKLGIWLEAIELIQADQE